MDIKQAAAQELLKRRGARDNFSSFCDYVYDNYESPWHVRQITDKLEAVERGDIKRLIITMPPRHSKSLHASVLFPAWYLGRNPDKLVVQTGYAADIAQKQSNDSRRIVTSEKYNKLFPNLTSKITKSLDSKNSTREWQTYKGGSYFATGVGGALVGRGADILLIDDPYKNRQEAGSLLHRRKVEEWYKGTAYTRLMPDAAIIIIMTRWHSDDLVGKLLKEQIDEWDILELPARKEDEYDALWPERYGVDELNHIEKTIGQREFHAQYLCKPIIETGNRFKVVVGENVKVIEEREFPSSLYIRAWDLASSQKERDKDDPDYTVGVLGAVTTDNNGIKSLWIKDMVYGRWNAPQRDDVIRNTAIKDGQGISVYIEAFGAYKDTYNHMRRILAGRNIVRKSNLSGDKTVKAAPLEPLFESGNVYIKKASWNDIFIKQFMEFPEGSHDDIVDAVSIVFGENSRAKSGLLMSI